MLNHELVPSRKGNGRQGTHRAGTVRPGTGGGTTGTTGTQLLAHARHAAGPWTTWPWLWLCPGITTSFRHTSWHKAGSKQGAGTFRHLQAPREHRGKVTALGASLQQDSSVLPLCLLAKLGTQSEPELGSAAFGLISPVTPSQGL